jgi:GAF domain-containing protein
MTIPRRDPVAPPRPPLTGVEATAVYDAERLAEIARLGLDTPEPDPVLAEAVHAAAAAVGLPIGMVTVVLDEAQFFLASEGLEGWLSETQGTPIEWSFCRFPVAERAPFVVDDAATHARTRDNPLVKLEGLRCYAGVPLMTSHGAAVGTLCVAGRDPHAFSPEDVARLRALADRVMAHLEARAAA